ncbi:MAG TPA: hypothetical protein VLK23_19570 [Thermodesulfobacteriota bacterium]|nr:hypothetical protein [Thermodesulfobacteriota bacterium]
MGNPTKKELLERYQTREPKLFVEIDAFKTTGNEDNLMQPDEDGLWFQARRAYELMDGVDVRIMIDPKANWKDVMLMLKKMIHKVEHDWPHLLEEVKEELDTTRGIDGIAESLIKIRGFQMNDFEALIRAAQGKLNGKTSKSDDECPFW